MKKIIPSLLLAITFTLGMLTVASAAIPNHFISTDGDSNFFRIFFNDSKDWVFGVYDYAGNPKDGLNLVDKQMPSALFRVTEDSGQYAINVVIGADFGKTMDIGSSNDFSFFFNDGDQYYTNFDIIGHGSNIYEFKIDENRVFGVDITPVPLPGSSVLLLSGLVGLVALGARRKK